MKSKIMLLIAVIGCSILAGCQHERFAMESEVFGRFYSTTLKLSKSSDIMATIKNDQELLSQGGNVIASWNQRKNGNNLWFNAVAFDEENLTAKAKYSFAYEQYDRTLYVNAVRKIRIDMQAVADADLLAGPYASENDRMIAVLKQVVKNFKDDMSKVSGDSQTLTSGTLTATRTLSEIITKLQQTPAMAAQLSEPAGMQYQQMNVGQSHVRMLIEDDIVKIKIKAGDDWFRGSKFEKQPDVVNM